MDQFLKVGNNLVYGNGLCVVLSINVAVNPLVGRDSIITMVEFYNQETGEIFTKNARELLEKPQVRAKLKLRFQKHQFNYSNAA